MTTGTTVECSCCGNERMAILYPREKLEIKDKRHGQRHVAVVTPKELLQRLSGTLEGSAVIHYVKSVFG